MDPSSKHKKIFKTRLLKSRKKVKIIVRDEIVSDDKISEFKDSNQPNGTKQLTSDVDIGEKPIIDIDIKKIEGKMKDKKDEELEQHDKDDKDDNDDKDDKELVLHVSSKQSIKEKTSKEESKQHKKAKAIVVTSSVKKQLDTSILLESIEPIDFDKKSHTYRYEPNLNTNFEQLSLEEGENYYICMYRVNTYALKPFLEYCFHKDKRDLLSFPVLKYKNKKPLNKEVSEFVKYIFKIDVEPSFYLRLRKNHNYIFINVEDKGTTYNVEFKKRRSSWWWALMTEIINYKKIMNFDIHPNIPLIFTKNPSLIYLKDEDDNIIEIPEVGFHGTYFPLLNFISIYGLRPSTLNSMLGPYYYFGTFRKAVRYAGWTSTYKTRIIDGETIADEHGRYKRGGIARFVVFLGKMKALLNHPQDRDDWSSLVEKRMSEEPSSREWEEATIKLHDHNGVWAEEYDSIYVGRATIKIGKHKRKALFMKNPEFVVKNFEQQFILTTHELDQQTLKDKWDGNYDKYNIL